mmetsp:Transcript_4385/g.9827  ORF Transcript_4385/g.9827 Transcript_4385/m.9827 type:complete len:93 (-) Transcript_4385:2245-2523(-)
MLFTTLALQQQARLVPMVGSTAGSSPRALPIFSQCTNWSSCIVLHITTGMGTTWHTIQKVHCILKRTKGLSFIDLRELSKEAAVLLIQSICG